MSITTVYLNHKLDQINNALFVHADSNAVTAWSATRSLVSQVTVPLFTAIGFAAGLSYAHFKRLPILSEELSATVLLATVAGRILGTAIANERAIHMAKNNLKQSITSNQARTLLAIKYIEALSLIMTSFLAIPLLDSQK